MVTGKETKESKHNFLEEKTGLFLPDIFNFLVGWEIKRSFRYQNFATLLILEPDQILQSPSTMKTLVNLIKKNIRETDLIGQIDRDKFGILLLISDVEGSTIIASRIIDHIRNYIFSQKKDQHLTVSIGGACFPIHSRSIQRYDLFKEAENALRTAKQKGDSVYFPSEPIFENPGG
jgi:hypothetical protein